MSAMIEYKCAVIGFGTMGQAIVSGVLSSLSSPSSTSTSTSPPARPTSFLCTVSSPSSSSRLSSLYSSQPVTIAHGPGANVSAASEADVIILACKPYLAEGILAEEGMRDACKGKVVVSVLAGTTVKRLREFLRADGEGSEETVVVRAMPNTPCKIRSGVTVITPLSPSLPHPLSTRTLSILTSLFSPLGLLLTLPESNFDAITSLSGSGPALALVFLESLIAGGVLMGLPRKEAGLMAASVLQGTARMVLEGGEHPAVLRDNVTTPGGTTISALMALEDGKFRSTVARAVQAGAERSAELAKK